VCKNYRAILDQASLYSDKADGADEADCLDLLWGPCNGSKQSRRRSLRTRKTTEEQDSSRTIPAILVQASLYSDEADGADEADCLDLLWDLVPRIHAIKKKIEHEK
jgi:hypothetical protein